MHRPASKADREVSPGAGQCAPRAARKGVRWEATGRVDHWSMRAHFAHDINKGEEKR